MASTKTTTRKRDNKITRVIVPALYANKAGLPINDVIDPNTGKPVEALYFYDAEKAGVIEKTNEPIRTGKRGRPAKVWKLTKATRDKLRKQEKRAEAKAAKAVNVDPSVVREEVAVAA